MTWMQYVKGVCGHIKCVFVPKFLEYGLEVEGSQTFLMWILSQKHKFATKIIHQLFFTDVKMFLCTGKIRTACKVPGFFVYSIDDIFAIFFKLGAWHPANTRACLLRFSALKYRWSMLANSRLSSATDHFHIICIGLELASLFGDIFPHEPNRVFLSWNP